jgi:hypothetical protein
MIFTVDIKGDTSGATQGAAALRAETAAGRETAATLALVGRGSAALATSSRGAADLAAGMREAQREAGALQAAQKALASGGDAVDVETYRALSAQIEVATGRAAALAQELAKSGKAGEDFGGNDKAEKDAAAQEDKRAKAEERAAKERAKEADKTKKDLKEAGKETNENVSSVLRYGAALAGIASAGELTRMALGWRGMAAVQMLSMKAAMDVRRLVAGIDPSPAVRGVTLLERNLSKSTVTGSALSGILTRGFGALFGLVEKGEPLVQSVFEGMVIGALVAEIALQKARIALAPLTVAIEDWLGSEDAMETAAYGGAAALAAVGVAAAIAAAPILATAAAFLAVGKAINEAVKLYREWDELQAARSREKAAAAAGGGPLGNAGTDAAFGAHVGGPAPTHVTYEKLAPTAAAAGVATGKALGDGMALGMAGAAPTVAGAADKLVKTADASARTAADAHSPSKLWREGLGADMGEGAAVGLEDKAGRVAGAADKLVPQPPGGGGGAPAGGPVQISIVQYFGAGAPEQTRAAAKQGTQEGLHAGLRQLAVMLGLPIPGTT